MSCYAAPERSCKAHPLVERGSLDLGSWLGGADLKCPGPHAGDWIMSWLRGRLHVTVPSTRKRPGGLKTSLATGRLGVPGLRGPGTSGARPPGAPGGPARS